MSKTTETPGDRYDVVIIGAGITGINAAYRISSELPHLSYIVLDRRDDLGGTWSFFKYPGIRSDSDLYTMGFAWKPWTKTTPIADGPAIVDYVRATAKEYGIDKKIKYGHDVLGLDWRSKLQRWELRVKVDEDERVISGRFVIAGTGFFDYRQPKKEVIPGIDKFKGIVAHPQFWSEKIDYTNKNVVIVGSGATAVTILPVVAQKAATTTMIQRSPTYILSMPMQSNLDDALRRWLPFNIAFSIVRWRFVIMAWLFFYFSQIFPNAAKWVLEKATTQELPKDIKYDPDFRPRYNVWDQRLCVCPDGDFFKALHAGKARVKTATITTVETDGVLLNTGERVPADIIITATGLKLQMLGGAKITLDNKRPIEVGEQYMWRGTMLQDVPNLMMVIGYWNNSWTLGSDLATRIFIKSIKRMESQRATSFVPTITELEAEGMVSRPLWNMSSTYLQNNTYPKASNSAPWSIKDNYMRDWWAMKTGDLTKGLQFNSQ